MTLSDDFYQWIRAADTGRWIVIPSRQELAFRDWLVNEGRDKDADLREKQWQERAEALITARQEEL